MSGDVFGKSKKASRQLLEHTDAEVARLDLQARREAPQHHAMKSSGGRKKIRSKRCKKN